MGANTTADPKLSTNKQHTAAKACFVVAGLLAVTVLGLWISYAVRQNKECTDKYYQICVDATLPGENENTITKEHTSYYLGGRTCDWFAKDPRRCSLKDTGDICFDKVDWKDKKGKFCEDWRKFIDPEETEKDVRKDGTNPRCNQPPQAKERDTQVALDFVKLYGNNSMSEADLREMKAACCICGAHRDKRNYAGSFPNQPFPGKFTEQVVPPQHKGKTATHLTQCCACKDHTSKEHAQTSNDLKKRGGKWHCDKEIRRLPDTDKFKYNAPVPKLGYGPPMGTRDDTKHAIFASAIVLTVVFGISLCVASFLCLFSSDSTDSTDSKVPGAKTDKPRDQGIAESDENIEGNFNNVKRQAQHSVFEPLL
jgi:hypothetical protein